MWYHFVIFTILLLQIFSSAFATSHYTVIGPGVIHSERKYSVAVAVHNITEPCRIKVGIRGITFQKHKIIEFNTANEAKLIDFDLPELPDYYYHLTTEGISGIEIYNTTQLIKEIFEPHILIQTDKGAYKPGDVVQFRVLFLDENFKPSAIKESTFIWFQDSKRNRIKEFRNLELVKGVYTGKLQISEYAALGAWRIIVQTKEINTGLGYIGNSIVYFNVEKYVLPKYVVKVSATEHVSVLDGDMQIVVRANYTYGKPVNAKTTIILVVRTRNKNTGHIPRIIKTTDMINGKAKFDLSIKEYDGLIEKGNSSLLNILATVEEELTGVKISATTYSTLYPYRYNINCETLATCSIYHADEEYEVVFKILHVDNSLVEDTKTVVRLIYTENIQQTWQPVVKLQSYVFESHLNGSSMVTFKVILPDLPDTQGYYRFFRTEVEFGEQKNEVNDLHPFRKPMESPTWYNPPPEPKDYFKLIPKYEKNKHYFQVGQEALFVVNSSVSLTYFVYIITGRGNVLKVQHVELLEPAKIHEFKFTPTLLMAPSATLYVHYVENDEYHYTEAKFSVEYKFLNKIDISVPEQVKVGEDAPFQISTARNSFVGLLAVDQRVLLHKEYNNINDRSLNRKLESYSTRTPSPGGYSTYPGQVSGVVTHTNAKYFYDYKEPDNYRNSRRWQMGGIPQGYVASSQSHYPSASTLSGPSFVSLDTTAGSSISPSGPAIQSNFAETWIFENIENTESENITWFKKVPETLTSWVITGFSLNAEKGFATTKDKSYVTSFQPFFVSIRLPYSVKRGEAISIPALVFNNLEKDLDVEVTLEKTDNEFEFIDFTNEIIDVTTRLKTLLVPAYSVKEVSFMIRPKIIGNILLKFKAVSPLAGDTIHKTLKVVPEGVTEYANRAYYVNLKDTGDFNETFELEIPENIVPDSGYAELSVVGDLLGPLFKNLDSLVRMPTGCGEQTMSIIVSNYLALRYLKYINNHTPALETRIRNNLELGYQNMLSFRHTDGSFSSFGPGLTYVYEPRNGSIWLTAYVIRFLHEASEYIHLDATVITEGLNYLRQRQASNGSFTEHGDFFIRSQSHEVSLTASVLLAFFASNNPHQYTQQTDAGLKFILENIEESSNLHDKALVIYTLKRAKHALASKYLTDIKALAKSDLDHMWWSSAEENVKRSSWWRWPRYDEVEMTSYVLLSLLDEENVTVDSVLPIVRWLVTQRNSYGGFSSTQDTVVGLQALVKFAEKSSYEPAEMHVDFATESKRLTKSGALDVNKDNAILVQSEELPAQTDAIQFQAKGTGAALVQVSYQYNIFEEEKAPIFTLHTVIATDTPPHKLKMDVCVDYVDTDSESNMALLEVSLPSGYVAEEDSFAELRRIDRVRHIELKKSGTNIVVYFQSLRKNDVKCLPIEAFKSFAVALQKPTPIVVYDYYDSTKKATAYYEISSKLCEICDKDEEECQKVCG